MGGEGRGGVASWKCGPSMGVSDFPERVGWVEEDFIVGVRSHYDVTTDEVVHPRRQERRLLSKGDRDVLGGI